MVADSEPGSWLWAIAFVFGWLFVGQVAVWVFLAMVVLIADFAGVFTACLLSVFAWFVTRYAYAHGAPRALWVTTLFAALPLFAIFASLMFTGFPDRQLLVVPAEYWSSVRAFAVSSVQMVFILVAPPLVAWYASKGKPRVVDSPTAAAPSGI